MVVSLSGSVIVQVHIRNWLLTHLCKTLVEALTVVELNLSTILCLISLDKYHKNSPAFVLIYWLEMP